MNNLIEKLYRDVGNYKIIMLHKIIRSIKQILQFDCSLTSQLSKDHWKLIWMAVLQENNVNRKNKTESFITLSRNWNEGTVPYTIP